MHIAHCCYLDGRKEEIPDGEKEGQPLDVEPAFGNVIHRDSAQRYCNTQGDEEGLGMREQKVGQGENQQNRLNMIAQQAFG